RLAEAVDRGKEIAPVERRRGADARIGRVELGAEVDALLPVRLARRELRAEREPAAPRAAAALHRDRALRVVRLREKPCRQRDEPLLERGIDAVPDRVEEAVLATRGADRARGRAPIAAADERADVDHGNARGPGHAGQPIAGASRAAAPPPRGSAPRSRAA